MPTFTAEEDEWTSSPKIKSIIVCPPDYLSLTSNSEKWEKYRTPNLKPHGRRHSLPVLKSGYKSSSNSDVCQSSPSLNHRSTSPQLFEIQQMQTSQRNISSSRKRRLRTESEDYPFDTCRNAKVRRVRLDNFPYESESKVELAENAPRPHYLRSGMLLLKNFISHSDQVEIANKCLDLGFGCGGFSTPEYASGGKLHLQMMCLGKHWDHQSKSYKDARPSDDAVPPKIPDDFRKQVDGALGAAHKFLQQSMKNVNEIPCMSPDVCIVNSYSIGGKLGLHQDKDESEESLEEGLPVVSFSIGDSAEFLYSNKRNVNEAEKVILESGDVLIFGGESRLIFHGVSRVYPNTAPDFLTDQKILPRPCRLNLTFRQF